MARLRQVVGWVGLLVSVAAFSPAQSGDPLATAQLQIQGTRLTIFSDGGVNDADQTINVGESARVRTCYGGPTVPCGSVLPGDPRAAGLKVVAELAGPELPQPVSYETLPGGAFVLPGFQQEGEYQLGNIRLISTLTGQVLGAAEPPVAVLHVRRIVLASATVKTLTLADLRAKGIALSQQNFQAFNFAVGFAFGTQTVTIDLPVLYQGNGQVDTLAKPSVNLDGLPADLAKLVERWTPPNIVPFALEPATRNFLDQQDDENQTLQFPLFGAIVVPGTLSFLNQFFEAQLIVANGAPAGSGANLANITGALRLPTGNVLRLAQSEPPVAIGQPVPVIQANGNRVLGPGEQGAASWTLEGLIAGTHVVQIDIVADLTRPGRPSLAVASRAQAAVEVVDARFNVTFSHPDVVREGEAYSLFVTVTNLSRATQNLISLELANDRITGAHKADVQDDLKRTIQSLDPGQSETVEFKLVADVTGNVVATTFQSDSAGLQATIRLRTGVGELGIPLSPASLVLPRFSERLATPYVATDDYFKATVRLLGLAYSLAVAPAGMAPAGLPHVTKADVERRAIDLGEAGQRTFLREGTLESLEVLALDQLGNRYALEEFDQLRRTLSKGLAAAAQLAALLRHEQETRNLDAVALFDHFAATTSYAPPYLAVLLVPTGADPAPQLELRQTLSDGTGYLAYASDQAGALRTVPFGEIYGLERAPASSDSVPLALVGHVATDTTYQVFLHNQTGQANTGRLLLLVPEGASGKYRRIEFGSVTIPAHMVYGVNVGASVPGPSQGGFQIYSAASGVSVPEAPTALSSEVGLPSFRLIGAVQDYGLPEVSNGLGYGQGVSYLFNRPPNTTSAGDASHYRIKSTFNGLDVAGQTVARESTKTGAQVFVQESGRVVNVRYAAPLSALVAPGGGPLLVHQHLLDVAGIRDAWGGSLDANVPPPSIESQPLHVGGLVDGRVVRGTGAGVAGATVDLIRSRLVPGSASNLEGGIVLDLVATTTTDSTGFFYFDFIEEPHSNEDVRPGYTLRATVPAGSDPNLEPAAVEEVTSIVRQQNRLAHVNIALLGRGSVTGTLVYFGSGNPVTNGSVTITSVLFSESQTTSVAADGSFTFGGVPVGPLTLTGRDPAGRRVYATVGLEKPGDTISVRLEIQGDKAPPGVGTITGKVMRQGSGTPTPPPEAAGGATVAVYVNSALVSQKTADMSGAFVFTGVPAGHVSLQAADWRISRTAVLADATLAADQTLDVTLTLAASTPKAITGKVIFHDQLTNTLVPVQGAVAFIAGPGVFAYTDATGLYRIEGVPTQGDLESLFSVTAIDYARKLQGSAVLPRIIEASPDVVVAQDIVLAEMSGGVDGVVLDPLGRPSGGVSVMLFPYGETSSRGDGGFSFNDIPLGGISESGDRRLVAHYGDGLQGGKVGWFGAGQTAIVFGGHRPFVTVQLRGSGVVNIRAKSATGTGVLTPIFYKPTWFSSSTKQIESKPAYIETSTDQNGYLQIELPVGNFEIVAYNPFHGTKTLSGQIDYAGQIKNLDVVFETTSTVKGTVLDVDGVTPVPSALVKLSTQYQLPQTQQTNAQGQFEFDLVPQGGLTVTAVADVANVERVGQTISNIATPGQTLNLVVQLKAQGTVRGRVVERIGSDLVPLPHAQFYVQEASYPARRLPQAGSWLTADADGHYEVAHLYVGPITVVARDPNQVARMGQSFTQITADWQIVEAPDIVMSTSVGSLGVTVRDPGTGAPVPDCQLKLSDGEASVADADGKAEFDALPLGGYWVYAFHAPTGRSGRVWNLQLSSAGQHLDTTVYLEQRGEVKGTLFDDAAKTVPVAGGTVQLGGSTNGGWMQALATTSAAAQTLGTFDFLGIPEGQFDLEATVQTSPRRARASVAVTPTAPIAAVDLVLEAAGERYFRIFEKLKAGLREVDPSQGVFSLRVQQNAYDFTEQTPSLPFPGHLFKFDHLLLARTATITLKEFSGEQRSFSISNFAWAADGRLLAAGTVSDPYELVLNPKGIVRVSVKDSLGQAVSGAQVTLTGGDGASFPSVSGPDGSVTFYGVAAGSLSATAKSSLTGLGGVGQGVLVYDDDVIDLVVTLAPSVSAHGIIYHPVPNDQYTGDPTTLVPENGAIVQMHDSRGTLQVVSTGPDGIYRFGGLATGGYSLEASDSTHQALARGSGTLVGPEGTDNALPALILDASPPRIVSLTPPPGMEGVSRTAVVEVVFSEPLDPAVLPTGQANPPYFHLLSGSGALASGSWTSALENGRQIVRFTPNPPYDNFTVYSVTIAGGSGGVRDRVGRLLRDTGNVGSNFKTADTVGPTIIATDPSLDRPVDPTKLMRFDFSEAVVATSAMLDGDGVGDAAELYWGKTVAAGLDWRPYPVTMFLTRRNYSLSVQPAQGVQLTDDSLQRRIVISRLADQLGNVMQSYERRFRIYDQNLPVIENVSFPAGAPDGHLVAGNTYTLAPALSHIDDVTPTTPGGDIDRVDYYLTNPADGGPPAYSSRTYPFGYSFVGAYGGNGTDPWPFSVWVRAVDTSTNQSNTVLVQMVVLPNVPPAIGSVTIAALQPVAGMFYAGSKIRATVVGLTDPDGVQLTVAVALWQQGLSTPIVTSAGVLVQRPASGSWTDLAPPTSDFTLPIALPEGSELFCRASALDSHGAQAVTDSAHFVVAHDAGAPVVEGLVMRLSPGGSSGTLFYIGDRVYVEFRARDTETAVKSVQVSFDRADIFPSPQTASLVPSSGNLYRTSTVTVPHDVFANETPVVVTASARDYGDNAGQQTVTVRVTPAADPNAPTATWLTPWEGAAWPASYTSVVSSQDGAALLLRARAQDVSVDASGNPTPGTIVDVLFRGPVINAQGGIDLASGWVSGALVAGTQQPGAGNYQVLWHMPNQVAAGTSLPFEVRVVNSGGKATVQSARMVAVRGRKVYESSTIAVVPTETMRAADGDPEGPVFVLDGTVLSVYPQDDGTVRALRSLYLYAGGSVDASGVLTVRPSVLTAPEVTSYDSAIAYYPLELQIGETLAVGAGSRIDMSRRGLLGGTTAATVTLDGESAAQFLAGGSHGGAGWYGKRSGTTGEWGSDGQPLYQPGTVDDSVVDPRLPGGGGGGGEAAGPGGTGGGVIRLLGDGALVRLVGDVVADGGSALVNSTGGGAGGAIAIHAGRLEGQGRISANGGNGNCPNQCGGGGGGRIALVYRELGDGFDLASQTAATGGHNYANNPAAATYFGGAGTIYSEQVDATTGSAAGIGVLAVRNGVNLPAALTPLPSLGDGAVVDVDAANKTILLDVPRVNGDMAGERVVLEVSGASTYVLPVVSQARVHDPTAPGGIRIRLTVVAADQQLQELRSFVSSGTPVVFHGRSRFASAQVAGAARLVTDDDLEIGDASVATPALNDRASVTLQGDGRVMLRGEKPAFSASATPPNGGDVRLGATIALHWSATDTIGFLKSVTSWSPAASPANTWYLVHPLQISGTPAGLSVPLSQPPGPVTFTITGSDLAARSQTTTLTWNVLANAPPTGTLSVAAGFPATVKAGFSTKVAVHAEDAEGLAKIELVASGPATQASQTVTVTGTSKDVTFDVRILASAAGDQPVVVRAVITDTSGVAFTTPTLEIGVLPNAPPTGTLALGLGAPSQLRPGQSTTLTVHAEDPDGLARIELRATGPATQASQTRTVSGTAQDVLFTLTAKTNNVAGTISATAVITDAGGVSFETAAVAVTVVPDTPPTGSVALSPAAGIYPNHMLTVTVTAQDDTGLKQATLTVSGAFSDVRTLQFPAGTSVQASTTYRIPVAATAGAQVLVDCTLQDLYGNTTTLAQANVPVLADAGTPVVTTVAPLPNATANEGDTVNFQFALADEVIVNTTTLQVDGQPQTVQLSNIQLPGDRWQATATASWRAPAVVQDRSVSWTLTAVDQAGNQGTAQGTLTVKPVTNPNAPVVKITCPVNGDSVLPGVAETIAFSLTDTDKVRDYSILVNGQAVVSNQAVDKTSFAGQYAWTPPASAKAGDSFLLHIEARDYADNVGAAEATLTVPEGEIHTGNQSLSSALNGKALVLGGGTFTVTSALDLTSLTVVAGATVIGETGQPLQITTSGELRVSCGASIDMTGLGYASGVTYPGATAPDGGSGGSHLGAGGVYSGLSGSTYGSVARPQEAGAGSGSGNARGGGVARLVAGTLTVDGAIRANGGAGGNVNSGAGGSVWMSAGTVAGAGSIEARGGESTYGITEGSGGGGAIAVEYGTASGSVLSHLLGRSGYDPTPAFNGGAGTVLVKGPSNTFGDLVVDNGWRAGATTALPSLGSGAAQPGTTAATLVTDRTATIPAYFVGHWVEVRDVSNVLKGAWRIASISSTTITLQPNGSETIALAVGDTWQGVYRFDSLSVTGKARLVSSDPIRTASLVVDPGAEVTTATPLDVGTARLGGKTNPAAVTLWSPLVASGNVEIVWGSVAVRSISAGSLVVRAGANLSPPPPVDDAHPESLVLNLSGDLVVESGGAISASGRGYGAGSTYPGTWETGAHLGYGGAAGLPFSTFGSISRPQEAGGGGVTAGGGVIRIIAGGAVTVQGAIQANGKDYVTGNDGTRGTGGSVWVSAGGAVSGAGTIEARGGQSSYQTSGGGGAVAIEQGVADSTLPRVVTSCTQGDIGGAGTLFVKGPLSTYGDLIVDNGGKDGQWTELPALGGGIAREGSAGAVFGAGFGIPPPVLYWKFDESSGAVASDSSGNGYAGAVRNGAAWVAGISNTALSFDPSNGDQFVVANPVGLFPTKEITAVLWVNTGDSFGTPLSYASSASAQDFVLFFDGSLTVAVHGESIDTGVRGFDDGVWHHLAVTWRSSDGRLQLFKDGVLAYEDTVAAGASLGAGGALVAGVEQSAVGVPAAESNAFTGKMDDVRIFAQELTGKQIAELSGRAIPPYFVGHWVEVSKPDGTAKGTWRIAAIAGRSVTLQPNGGETISIDPGDLWQGVCRFDNLTVTGKAKLRILDKHQIGKITVDSGSTLVVSNWVGPAVDVGKVTLRAHDSAFWIAGAAGAVVDADGIASALVRNTVTSQNWPVTVAADGSFAATTVAGSVGDTIALEATDAHPVQALTTVTTIGGLPANSGAPVITAAGIQIHWAPQDVVAAGYELVVAAGAISDNEPPIALELTDQRSGSKWQTSMASGVALTYRLLGGDAKAGDLLELRVTDSHPTAAASASITLGPLSSGNLGGPVVDLGKVTLRAHDSAFWIAGAAGAVVDADGIASALVRNTVTSQSWPVTVAADGSFAATAVVGSVGDTIVLEATDAHPVQPLTTVTTIGGLPANSGAPVITAAGIQIHWAPQDVVAAGYELVVAAGAISDNEPPIALELTDQRSGSKWQTSMASGVALTYRLLGGDAKAGDLLELRVTDSHPTAPASASITLGPLPEEAQTQVDTSKIRLLAMGHGYQAGGTPGAVTDPAPPITVVLKNQRTEWQSSVLHVRSDGGFYARVEGQEGDEFTLVATVQKDGAPVSTAPVSLGQLPATGVYVDSDLLTGHTISALRDRLAVLDGGTQIVWMADLPPTADHFYPGVTAARDVFFNYRLQMPMALAGGDVVGWLPQGTPPTLQPITLAVSPGVLTRAKVRGDELYAVAEESAGLVLYRLTLPVISNGALTVDCGDTIRATPIPGTGGLHALEILPAGDGRIAVLTDDPTAELRVLDASDPVTTTVVGSLDLAGASLPKWGAWQTGELFVGRADGSLELWRWADAGMQRVTSWHPAQAEARAVVRMGDELFVGTSVGVVQQVDIWDASQPRLLGENVIGGTIVAMSQELDRMLVATAQDLNAVTVPNLALTLAPDSVSWSYGGGRMVAAATFGGFWAGSASFAWSDGTKGIANDCPFCEVAIDGDVHNPPTVTAFTGDGVQSAPYTPSAVRLRSFDAGTGPDLVRVPHSGPLASCDATRAAASDAPVSVGGPHGGWLVYGFAGQVDTGYRFTDPNTNEVTTRTLATNGPLLDVGISGLYFVTIANDLTLWDVDVSRGADPYNPVKRQQLALQIGTPEVVRTIFWGPILLAANAPARYAAVVPDPEGIGSNAFEVVADNVALAGLEGKIRDLYLTGNVLYVLTDAGLAGRIYAYDNSAPDQPTLLAQVNLSAGAPGVALGVYGGDDSNTVAEALTVVRRGWGVETYSLNLSAMLASLRLPGDARALSWRWGNYVILGNVGVARLLGPPSQPTPQYLLSNLLPPGNVTHEWAYGLVASEGVPWP